MNKDGIPDILQQSHSGFGTPMQHGAFVQYTTQGSLMSLSGLVLDKSRVGFLNSRVAQCSRAVRGTITNADRGVVIYEHRLVGGDCLVRGWTKRMWIANKCWTRCGRRNGAGISSASFGDGVSSTCWESFPGLDIWRCILTTAEVQSFSIVDDMVIPGKNVKCSLCP